MPQNYNDLYLRDYTNDVGLVPEGNKEYASPDIIPTQQRTLTPTELIRGYGGPPTNTNINFGQANNIYVRTRNLGSFIANGTMKLYYAESSLLMTPNLWLNNPIKTVSGADFVQIVGASGQSGIQPNEIGVGNEPFSFTPLRVPPDGYHFCFVGVINTPQHPVNVPFSFDSNEQFALFESVHPGVSMRNVQYLPAGLSSYQQRANLANIDSIAKQYLLIVSASDWPDQTMVNLHCMSPDFPFSFTQPIGTGTQNISINQTLPPNFLGDVVVTLTPPPGKIVSADAWFRVRFALIAEGEKQLRKYASTGASLGLKGALGPVRIIVMGGCSVYLGEGPSKEGRRRKAKK